jgi:hypothetical protein
MTSTHDETNLLTSLPPALTHLSLSEGNHYGLRIYYNHLMYFVRLKSVCVLLKEAFVLFMMLGVTLYFYYCYFTGIK